MEISKITSAQNPTIKLFSQFNRKKSPNQILLDGPHLNLEYFKSTHKLPETVLVSQSFMTKDEYQQFTSWPQTLVPDGLMAKISPTKNPSGIISITGIPKITSPAESPLTIILESIQDPGNLGTMLRTANAMGANVLLLGDGCDPWGEKALRAGMGAQFYVPCQKINDLSTWKNSYTGTLISTQLNGQSLWASQLPSPMAFVFGNEGQGVSAETQALCDHAIRIPMKATTESLNVAASLAILTHEFNRQQDRL